MPGTEDLRCRRYEDSDEDDLETNTSDTDTAGR